MADTKLSALTELDATPATGDELYIRDVSEATADESKRITYANLVTSSAATNAEMVAASSTTVFATPDNLDHHPAVAKAWANINAAGDTLSQDYGCSSVSLIGTGHYRTVLPAGLAASNPFFGGTNSVGSDDIVTFNMNANTQFDSYVLRAGTLTNVGHCILTFGAFA